MGDGGNRGERDAAFIEPHHLIGPPLRQHAGKILALVGAAAFGAGMRRRGNRARHRQHVAQVEPFEPAQVERRSAAGRPVAERTLEVLDRRQRACQPGLGPERSDVVGHDGLQTLDHDGRLDLVALGTVR